MSVRVMPSTLGTPRNACSIRAWSATSLGAGYCLLGGLRSKSTRPSARKPTSIAFKLIRVRKKRPAPATSSVESATWKATIVRPLQPLRCFVEALPPSLIAVPISARVALHAGAMPKSTPVTRVTPAVKLNTLQSKGTCMPSRSQEFSSNFGRAVRPRKPNKSPTDPPIAASIRLSVRTWRRIRPRPAPSARRTPISLCLADERASIRFAILAQARRSTNPTTASSICTGWANCLPLKFNPLLPSSSSNRGIVSSFATVMVALIAALSATFKAALDCSNGTPGFSRAINCTHQSLLFDSKGPLCPNSPLTSGIIDSGMNISGEFCTLLAPVKARGFTPMTVTGVMLTVITFPTASGAFPNARSHNPSLMVATAPVPGAWSSEGRIARPSAGRTPICSYKLPETNSN